MTKEILNEEISAQEFINILKKANIKIKHFAVEENSMLDGLQRKLIILPKNVLIGPIVRNDQIILPDGDTVFMNGDIIIFMGNDDDLNTAHGMLSSGGASKGFKRVISKFFSRFTHKGDLSGGY